MDHQKIHCGYGPEDIDVETNTSHHRLIISCTQRRKKKKRRRGKKEEGGKRAERGGMWFYNFDGSDQATPFSLQGYPKENIMPHGMCIVNHKDESYLYVISHEDYDKILKFKIQRNELLFIREWSGKSYTFFDAINDLFVTKEEYIYVTNPGKPTLKKKKGSVYLLKPENQFEGIIDDVYLPNGILINGDKLYLTAFRGDALYEYTLKKDGTVNPASKTKLASIKSGDNITLNTDELIIATHPNKFKFVLHALFKLKSPSAVYSHHLNSGKTERIFYDKGKIISGSSTAIKIENDLYISQVFEDFIIKVDLEGADVV